jgi:hypothetical protein
MQMIERQVREEHENQREAAMSGHIENKRLRELELEYQLEQEKLNHRMRTQQMNQEQIASKERQRQEEGMTEFQRDKADVDALVSRICAEDRDEADARRAKMEAERNVMEDARRERQAQKVADLRWEAEQDARIEEFAQKKREQEEEMARAKEQQELERRRIFYSMLDQQVAKQRETERQQQIHDDYHE